MERGIFLFIIQNSLRRFCGIDRCIQSAQYVKCKHVLGWLCCLLDTNRDWPKVHPTAPDPAFGFTTISSITWISSIIAESEIALAIKCRCFHYATVTVSAKADNEKTWQPAVIAKFLLVLFIYLFSVYLLCLWVAGSVFNLSCTLAKMINGIPMHSDWFSQVI